MSAVDALSREDLEDLCEQQELDRQLLLGQLEASRQVTQEWMARAEAAERALLDATGRLAESLSREASLRVRLDSMRDGTREMVRGLREALSGPSPEGR